MGIRVDGPDADNDVTGFKIQILDAQGVDLLRADRAG